MGGGALIKVGLGAFFVWASSHMGTLAAELIERARLSVQASELATLDNHLAAWSVGSGFEKRRGGAPATQQAFERTVNELFTQRGARRPYEDRWGTPYRYERLSDRPPGWRISSCGPDRRPGTDDDLAIERRGDAVHLDTDPVAIAEGAIERQRERDARVLAQLRRLTAGEAGAKPNAKTPARPAKPLVDDLPAAERAKLERELTRRTLDDLRALLQAPPR